MSGTKVTWICTVCGYVHEGESPPDSCPLCGVGPEFFERVADDEPAETGEVATTQPLDGQRIVIVGGGIAAVSAAEAARATDTTAQITMLAGELAAPYWRVNLTRYLAGEITGDLLELHPSSWYRSRQIDLRLGVEVGAIERQEQRVIFRNGESLPYDRLILATGAHPYMPSVLGNTRRNVVTVRSLQDAERILAELPLCQHAVVLGGGLLGMEMAAALAKHSIEVIVLVSSASLLSRQLNATAAGHLERQAKKLGLKFVYGQSLESFDGDERVREVVLSDGVRLPADLVVVSTGIRPNSALARAAGLKVTQGVEVDDTLCTSDPLIFAAGDTACHRGRCYGLWDISRVQGSIAGHNAVVGSKSPQSFHETPLSASLKVMGIDMFSIGEFVADPSCESTLCFEEVINSNYYYFQFAEGRLCGANLIGDLDSVPAIKQAMSLDHPCDALNSSFSTVEVIEFLQRIVPTTDD